MSRRVTGDLVVVEVLAAVPRALLEHDDARAGARELNAIGPPPAPLPTMQTSTSSCPNDGIAGVDAGFEGIATVGAGLIGTRAFRPRSRGRCPPIAT